MKTFYEMLMVLETEKRLYLEMFEKLGMEGISKREDEEGTYYKFSDKNGSYLVTISNYQIPIAKYFPGSDNRNLSVANLILQHGYNYGTTGKGNFGYVYNKMISSIKDFLDNNNIDIIHFYGFEDHMNRIYQRMLDQFAKTGNPNYIFHQISEEDYIKEQSLRSLPIEIQNKIEGKIASAKEQKKVDLDRILRDKNQARRTINQPVANTEEEDDAAASSSSWDSMWFPTQ